MRESRGARPRKGSRARIARYFSNETANLILARILLIRFLEDHGFFDSSAPDGPVRRRYLCNGGVAAFQGMRSYFNQGYTRLLEEAYRIGGSFYSAAFDESEMDWVFALSDPDLSRTVEWAMFRMARFDFLTARGDLLTGVYERFLDRKQRKDQGEYYTPPSIVRYVLDRLRARGLTDDEDILDPACGSGTFLIERYRQVVGEAADAGLADYGEGRAAVERLHGNDLNPFSAIVTQIQLLWHLLAFGASVRRVGFPDLRISERANSLVPVTLLDPSQNRFGEIDRTGYGAVTGNPPYIRPERGPGLEAHAQKWFELPRTVNGKTFPGMPVGRNAYPLFIYRALDHWCRQPEKGQRPGLLGFIIPLGMCGSRETARLRELFQIGGRWAIREIVDMELIWREIFDADVLPMVLIAEACPAAEDDEVLIRLADESCVHRDEGARKPTFRLTDLPEHRVPYRDVIAPDGAILTRLTASRTTILRKLWACQRLETAAQTFWSHRSRTGTVATTAEPTGAGANRWHKDVLIKDGARLRRQIVVAAIGVGFDVYKGENITAARFAGEPVHRGLDISQASAPSIWAYSDALPDVIYALPTIERVPVAAPFNPHTTAVLNTCSVFAPRADLADVPFDVVLLSRIYSWFYVIAGRRSFLNKLRSHIYPTSIAALPWSDTIAARRTDLLALRHRLLIACRRLFEQQAALREAAQGLGMQELRALARTRLGARIVRSVELTDDKEFILSTGEIEESEGEWMLPVGDEGEEVTFNDTDLASLARAGLLLRNGELTTWGGILRTAVPVDRAMATALELIVNGFHPAALEEAVELEVDAIDAIVGPALGLSAEDISYIQTEMTRDPFLSKAIPRYPFFQPKQRGRRLSLERGTRYSAA
jgi:SAM-dependent methyltransferase